MSIHTGQSLYTATKLLTYWRPPVGDVRRWRAWAAGYVWTERHSILLVSRQCPTVESTTPPTIHNCVQNSALSAQTWAIHDSRRHRRRARHWAATDLHQQSASLSITRLISETSVSVWSWQNSASHSSILVLHYSTISHNTWMQKVSINNTFIGK